MKWTTSQVIAALAVISPVATAWITSHTKLTSSKISVKQARIKQQNDRLNKIEKDFQDFVEITYTELSDTSQSSFSSAQKQVEARVLINANDDLYKAIDEMHKSMTQLQFSTERMTRFRKVVSAFNKQHQQVPTIWSRMLSKIKSLSSHIKGRLSNHKQ